MTLYLAVAVKGGILYKIHISFSSLMVTNFKNSSRSGQSRLKNAVLASIQQSKCYSILAKLLIDIGKKIYSFFNLSLKGIVSSTVRQHRRSDAMIIGRRFRRADSRLDQRVITDLSSEFLPLPACFA
jgi:hypothetical protein